jgi:hypothetical protein
LEISLLPLRLNSIPIYTSHGESSWTILSRNLGSAHSWAWQLSVRFSNSSIDECSAICDSGQHVGSQFGTLGHACSVLSEPTCDERVAFEQAIFATREATMAKKSSASDGRRIHESGEKALEVAIAKKAGAAFEWHFGKVNCLGCYEIAGGRSVTISWEGGGVTSQQGNISDGQWEIFKLAFMTTGRIAILSELPRERALYDYRFLEVLR